MADTRLTVRLSPWLRSQIASLAAGRGVSQTAIVREALLAVIEGVPPLLPTIPDRDELLRLLTVQVRAAGSVSAMRLLLEELRRDGDEPEGRSTIDDLAARRKPKGAGA